MINRILKLCVVFVCVVCATSVYAVKINISSLNKIADKVSFLQTQYLLTKEQLAIVQALRTKEVAIPNGKGNFTEIIEPAFSLSKTKVKDFVFVGKGNNKQFGLYLYKDGKVTMIVNQDVEIPNGVGFFDEIKDVSFDADSGTVAFVGTGNLGLQGIYFYDGKKLSVVVDQSSMMPIVIEKFRRFYKPSLLQDTILFYGEGENQHKGLYFYSNGEIIKVLSIRDNIDKKPIRSFALGRYAFQGPKIIFGATFSDGTQGVFVANLAYSPY